MKNLLQDNHTLPSMSRIGKRNLYEPKNTLMSSNIWSVNLSEYIGSKVVSKLFVILLKGVNLWILKIFFYHSTCFRCKLQISYSWSFKIFIILTFFGLNWFYIHSSFHYYFILVYEKKHCLIFHFFRKNNDKYMAQIFC